MSNKFPKKEGGFTLAELLIAIFVLTTGIVGVYLVIQRSVSVIDYSYSRLTAAYLAQEGIEIVRNIKDTNLLEVRSDPASNFWNDNLEDGDWQIEYTTPREIDPPLYPCPAPCDYSHSNLWFLKKADGGFYNYSSGNDTQFKRKINIQRLGGGDILRVKVTVYWQRGHGKIYEFTIQDNFYNWIP